MPLVDRKPSELYYEMKRVAGSTLGDVALKGLWVKRLPEVLQAVIAASTGTVAEFTKIAVTIIDALSLNSINQISADHINAIRDLTAMVASIQNQLDQLKSQSRNYSKSRSSSRDHRRRSSTRTTFNNDFQSENSDNECRYHRKYGRNARKCRSPCQRRNNFAPNASTSD